MSALGHGTGHRRLIHAFALLLLPLAGVHAAGLPDEELRQLVGAEIYDRVTGISRGALSVEQRAALEDVSRQRQAFAQYDPGRPETHQAAREGLARLFGGGEGPPRIATVHWLLEVKAIDPDLSVRLAEIRNRMVFEVCEEMARLYGEVHRVDFSPAKNLLNDIDHTFKAPEQLAALGIDGQRFVAEFERIFKAKFGIDPRHMDVMSHPYEASIPRWDVILETGDWNVKQEVHEFVGRLRKGSALLAANPEAYFLEGAFRMQVERRSYESADELYSIFAANPHDSDGGVARVAVKRGTVRQYRYEFIPPPVMLRTYAWGSSVGNWHFARQHGLTTRFLAKYGLRSFAESVAWIVEHSLSPDPSSASPKTYEDMVDETARRDLVDRVYEKHYRALENTYLSKEEVWWTIEKAKAIRKAGQAFSREAAFTEDARRLAPGRDDAERAAAFQRCKSDLLRQVEERFSRNMTRIMVENIKCSLPDRLADWLDPQVSAYRLGFTAQDIENDAEGVRRKVDAARRKLRVSALLEVLHGLRALDPAERTAVLSDALSALRKKYAGRKVTFERTLLAVWKLAAMSEKPRLLQSDQEAGRRPVEYIGEEERKRLRVRTDDPVAVAETLQGETRRAILETMEELRTALNDEIRPDLEVDPGDLPAQGLRMALDSPRQFFLQSWDRAMTDARRTLQRGREFVLDPQFRRLALVDLRKQVWDGLGYEFRKDWTAMEGLDFARDSEGFSRGKLARSVVSWSNVDSLLAVVRAYRESGGDPQSVASAVFLEAASRLPVVGESLTLVSTLSGESHPLTLGVLVGTFFCPQIGVVTLAYSIADNTFAILKSMELESQTRLHMQGTIPSADGSPGPGAAGATEPAIDGILAPVYRALLERRRALQTEVDVTSEPERRSKIEDLLARVYTPDIAGARNFVYDHFNPDIERRFLEDPARWPREKWNVFKLSLQMSTIPDSESKRTIESLPSMPRRFFRKWVDDYLSGKGRFAALPNHLAAHRSEELSRRFFFSNRGAAARQEATAELLTAVLTDAYVKSVRTGDPALEIDPAWDRAIPTTYPARAYIEGVPGSRLVPYDRPRLEVPDLPSILDVVAPDAPAEEKRRKFFAFFDGEFEKVLEERHRMLKDCPPDIRKDLKLGTLEERARDVAPEEAAVSHPLLMAFFNRRVAAYASDLEKLVPQAAGSSLDSTGGGLRRGVSRLLVSSEVRSLMVQQLVRDFVQGLYRDAALRQESIDRRMLDQVLPNASALSDLGAAVWGADEDDPKRYQPSLEALRQESARLLGIHSGDPHVTDDEKILNMIRLLVEPRAQGIVKITDMPAGPLGPGDLFAPRCSVTAPPDRVRPFRVEWSLSRVGETAESAPRTLPDSAGSNLMLTSLQIANAGSAAAAGEYSIRATVTDATGREVGSASAPFRVAAVAAVAPGPAPEPARAGGAIVKMAVPGSEGSEGRGPFGTSTLKYTWHDPDSKLAHPFSAAEPNLWIGWPDRPEPTGVEISGRMVGGIPPLEKEFRQALSGVETFEKAGGRLVQKLNATGVGHRGNAFVFALPMERGHGGEFTIEGKLSAYRISERGQWRGEPLAAEKPFSVRLSYFPPPPPQVKGSITVSPTGTVRGSIRLTDVQAGRRVAAITAGGKTCYDLLAGPGTVSFVVPNASAVPATAEVRFRDFGAEQIASASLDRGRSSGRLAVDRGRVDRLLTDITKLRAQGARQLDAVLRCYRDLASCYAYSSGDLLDPQGWTEAMTQCLTLGEHVVRLKGDPAWEGHGWQGPVTPRLVEEAQKRQQDAREKLFLDAASAAECASKCGLVDAAGKHLAKADEALAQLSPDRVAGRLVSLAQAYQTVSAETFRFTGDIDAARALWQKYQALQKQDSSLRGQSFSPRPFPYEPDPAFQTPPRR